jgi:hypothetical protein
MGPQWSICVTPTCRLEEQRRTRQSVASACGSNFRWITHSPICSYGQNYKACNSTHVAEQSPLIYRKTEKRGIFHFKKMKATGGHFAPKAQMQWKLMSHFLHFTRLTILMTHVMSCLTIQKIGFPLLTFFTEPVNIFFSCKNTQSLRRPIASSHKQEGLTASCSKILQPNIISLWVYFFYVKPQFSKVQRPPWSKSDSLRSLLCPRTNNTSKRSN